MKFGIPQVLLTVQGSNSLSDLFANVCKLLRIKRIKTSPYNPQTNGALERTHRVSVEYLRCYILENQTDWDKWIPYATFVFNNTPHSSTGFTPHELLIGRKTNKPGILQRKLLRSDTIMSYVQELHSRLQSCYVVARSNLRTKKEKSKGYCDRNTNVPLFTISEELLLRDE